MKTILFAWELGRGLGHLMNIRRISARLSGNGLRLVAAIPDPHAATVLGSTVSEVVQAPPWPLHARPASSATLNDILSAMGLADQSVVQRLLGAWDDILARVRPDLVVADFSPMAALAARDRVPRVLIGNGYTLPPHEMLRFPLLHRLAPPASSEDWTLAQVNNALHGLGRPSLDRLPLLFEGEACQVQTFPLLDPYDTQRSAPVDGPLFDRLPQPRAAGASAIFAYLSGGYGLPEAAFEAIQAAARMLRIHVPGLPVAALERLRQAGAHIEPQVLPLADVLSQARLVVHHGGTGIASEALVAGVPQLVLAAQVEQELNGSALERAGAGRLVKLNDPGDALGPALLPSLADDTALAARAADLGEWHRRFAKQNDSLARCAAACLRFVKS